MMSPGQGGAKSMAANHAESKTDIANRLQLNIPRFEQQPPPFKEDKLFRLPL